MGWSLGAAIGAKLAHPDRLVVHLLGDASFGMTGMEIETAVRMNLPTLTVVINNGGIGGGMMGMDRPGGTPPTVAQLGGNFSEVARGLGAYSERVEEPSEILPAFQRAIRTTEDGQAALGRGHDQAHADSRASGRLVGGLRNYLKTYILKPETREMGTAGVWIPASARMTGERESILR